MRAEDEPQPVGLHELLGGVRAEHGADAAVVVGHQARAAGPPAARGTTVCSYIVYEYTGNSARRREEEAASVYPAQYEVTVGPHGPTGRTLPAGSDHSTSPAISVSPSES